MTIHEHPLAWRWTKAEHAILSQATLAQMIPIEESEAAHLWRRSLHLVTNNGLDPAEFSRIARHSADVSLDAGRDWLREQQAGIEASIIISWDQNAAIRTTWNVFTSYWDTFCYPASDDVLIFPDSKQWVLFYFHGEEFQFGHRSMAEPNAAPNGGPAASVDNYNAPGGSPSVR